MIYFQLLFLILIVSLGSQTIIIDEMKYKTILVDDDKEFSKEEFTQGSFMKNQNDLVVCKGRMWTGNPPKSRKSFEYKDKPIENIGKFNNEAVELLERNKEGDWSEANAMLDAMISFDPQFFPARYNYARFLYLQKNFKEASYEFIQAKNIIPDYYRNYLHLGLISIYLGNKQEAEMYLKQAIKLNSYPADEKKKKNKGFSKQKPIPSYNLFNNEAYIYLAEIYWKEGLLTRAKEYIRVAEKGNDHTEATIIRRQKPSFPVLDFTKEIDNPNASPNPKIGEALLYFHQEKYSQAYKIFKSIDTANLNKEKVPYLKKMHYYFAESATKILDYKTAAIQYAEMLKYPFDPFFQEVEANTVVRKQNLAASVK